MKNKVRQILKKHLAGTPVPEEFVSMYVEELFRGPQFPDNDFEVEKSVIRGFSLWIRSLPHNYQHVEAVLRQKTYVELLLVADYEGGSVEDILVNILQEYFENKSQQGYIEDNEERLDGDVALKRLNLCLKGTSLFSEDDIEEYILRIEDNNCIPRNEADILNQALALIEADTIVDAVHWVSNSVLD